MRRARLKLGRLRRCSHELASPLAGIVLFTHHKYQKAISATGEQHLDAHGRSIRLPSDADGLDGGGEESVPLTALEGRSPQRDEESGPASSGGFLGGLFKVRRPSHLLWADEQSAD